MKINIAKHMTNSNMLRTLRTLRAAGDALPAAIGSRLVKEHFQTNVNSFLGHRDKIIADGGFIENQNEFTDMYYGSATVSYSGCEVIAVYNVLRALTGREPSLPKLIAAFEKNGMIFYGNLGTDPGEMKYFLQKHRFLVEEFTNPAEFINPAENIGTTNRFSGTGKPIKKCRKQNPADEAYILTFYNDIGDILQGLHTAAVTSDGRWLYLHNDGGTGARGPYADLACILKEYDQRGAGMISVMHVKAYR